MGNEKVVDEVRCMPGLKGDESVTAQLARKLN